MLELTVGQKVICKHKNGRYYQCDVVQLSKETFYEVNFDDGSFSDNLFPEDIVVGVGSGGALLWWKLIVYLEIQTYYKHTVRLNIFTILMYLIKIQRRVLIYSSSKRRQLYKQLLNSVTSLYIRTPKTHICT